MEFGLRKFTIWYLIFYFFIEGALRDILIQGQTDTFDLTSSIFAITSPIILFLYALLTYYTLYKFYPKRKWIHCGLGLVLSLICPIIIRFVIEQRLMDLLIQQVNYRPNYGIKNYVIDNYFFAIRYMTFGTIYYFITYSLFKQNNERDLLLSKQDIESALLKSQLNPHFLLNSLNNIYSLVFHKSDQALPAMDKLTRILKYNLYESKDFVSLKKEVEISEEFIELSRHRFHFPININMNASEESLHIQIPQHLLLPIVENSLKHGVLNNPDSPAKINIYSGNKHLYITSTNEVNANQKDSTGGIGLRNLERRLQIIYSTSHSFDLSKTDNTFSLTIKIPIS